MWAGTKDDKKGLEEYKKRQLLKKSNRLVYLTKIIHDNHHSYFDDGTVLISGSMIQNKVGLIQRDVFKDLDLNILKCKKGDEFVLAIKAFLEKNLDWVKVNIRDNLSGTIYSNMGGMDLFRNSWSEKDVKGKCEIFPGVETFYLTNEYMVKAHIKSYRTIFRQKEIYEEEHWKNNIRNHLNSLSQMKKADIPSYLIQEIDNTINEKIR